MQRNRTFTSLYGEDYDAIEVCPCEEEEDVDRGDTLRASMPSSNNLSVMGSTNVDAPIVVYRKNIKKCRSPRCVHHRRVLQKNGVSYLMHSNVPFRYARYLRDLSNTMINSRWRWICFSLMCSFAILWFLFGWFWMLIAMSHGDLDERIPRNDTCTVGVDGFSGFLLMSVETQTTIGYGSRYPTENCPEGVFMLCLQMILGIGVQGAILGMVYVKMTRSAMKDSQKLFSRTAVIYLQDGRLCLMFRVGDKRRSHIVGTKISAYLMENRRTVQGEVIQSYQTPLKLEPPGLLLWPLTVVHRITEDSPLWDFSAKDLLEKKFEIVVIMVGSSDSTGQMTQSRTSYLASEIRWGHKFLPCVRYDYDKHAYVVHQEAFGATEEVDTPLCSAHRLQEVLEELEKINKSSLVPAFPTEIRIQDVLDEMESTKKPAAELQPFPSSTGHPQNEKDREIIRKISIDHTALADLVVNLDEMEETFV